jgi:hypothetical protein
MIGRRMLCLAVFVALSAALVAVACGGEGEEAKPPAEVTAATTSTVAAVATEEAPAAPTEQGAPTELACTHYVAPDGSDDNPGTDEAPWQTIQHAADTAGPGDTVCIHAGTYSAREEGVVFSLSGTADAPITFAAAPGEKATVQGGLILPQGTSYVRLIGLAVQEFPIWGIELSGDNHHILLSNLDVSGGEASVRLTYGESEGSAEEGPVSDVVLEDSVLHDCGYESVDCTPGPCDRLTFRRLEIYGAGSAPGAEYGGDGLSVARGQDILVEDSYIHDNGGDGIDLNSRDTEGNVTGIVVRRNRVVRNHLNGIKLWAGGRMENNVVWGQGDSSVWLGVHPGVFEVVNNTIAYNAGYPEEWGPADVQLTLVNNIFAYNGGPELGEPTALYLGEGVELVEHHNLYWSLADEEIYAEFVSGGAPEFGRTEIVDGTWTSATGQGEGDVTADPLFESGWPDVDLHLSGGSPAVDAGSADVAPSEDVEGHARDGTPDIGAYER